jgi:hypothetical protein
MPPLKPALARRASLLGDLRIILLGSWGFIRQLYRSWRLTPKLLEQAHDNQQEP